MHAIRAAMVCAVLALALSASAAEAQSDSTGTAVAVRATHPPRIDGRDDDEIWRIAPVHSGFHEFRPREDSAARFRTEFRVAYDDRNLYVFVRAFDSHPDSIMHALSRHDVRGPSDQLKVLVDAYHDRRSGVEFAVNPDGVKREYAISVDANEDESWNGIWEVATTVDSLGWNAEFRIPFSQLRYADAPSHVFGFGIWRDIERFKERTAWPYYRESKAGITSQLGELTGITQISSSHTLEVTPYVVAKNSSRTLPAGFTRVQQETIGGDVKYGITPNLTLDATVNPDFGQVEADPAVLNLTAFETFFPEKRPFFIEGAGLYQFGINCNAANCNGEGLFYSRRIGRPPSLLDTYGDASSPSATPIAAAAKVTGRLRQGLSLGVLDAMTPVVHGIGGATTIEPRTNYALVRLQQDLRDGQSGFGVIGTAVNRALDAWTTGALRSAAYVGGSDFRHRFADGTYELSGSVTASRVEGSPATIAELQRSAVHYYQRPDGALRFDSTRTSLSGDAEELLFGKISGITRFQTSYLRQSAGYEPNDLGFLLRADEQSWTTFAGLQYNTPHWFFRAAQVGVAQVNTWSTAGLRLENSVTAGGGVVLKNNWNMNAGATFSRLGKVYCDRCTRGGPAVRVSPGVSANLGVGGDDRQPVVPALSLGFGRSDAGRSSFAFIAPSAEVKLSTRLQTSIGVSVTHAIDDGQWYGNLTDAAGMTHYTFAPLDRETISVTARASFALTPNLTVEVYAQPFVTTGTYTSVRQLSATPRAAAYDDRFAPYTLAPGSSTGFSYRQLQSNTVVRWEYRPGSTLFVVWQHGRQDFVDGSDRRPWDAEFHDLFALHPDNTFLVKLAYWLSR